MSKADQAAIELRNQHRAKVIARYYELDAKVTRFKPISDEHDALRKEIQSWYKDEKSDSAFEFEAGDLIAVIGLKENRSEITDMDGLFKRLSKSVFLKLATITLKKLEAVIPPEEMSKYVTQERTGWRSVKVVPKALSEPGV